MRRIAILWTAAVAAAAAIAGPAAAQVPVKAADYDFLYTYPPAAARIAPLRRWLDGDRAALRARLVRDAAADRREARRGGYPFHRWEWQTNWKVVTETPRFLSLSSAVYSFSGGAHGNPGSNALLWDKAAARRLAPVDVFTSRAALAGTVSRDVCRLLDAERVKRRGEPVKRADMFGNCPALKELTVLLGSTDRRRIDRIGFVADPYVAGPFAEGSYEVTLPVTAAVLRTVKPAYRAAFAAR